jgi:hypothetical protein
MTPLAPPVIVTLVKVAALAFAVSVPPLVTTRFDPPEMVLSLVVRVPEIVSEFDMSVALLIVIVPLMVRAKKPSPLLSVLTVFVAPLRVTVLVPFVNVLPTPEVSQLPDAAHVPEVREIVPLDPPVIVTSVEVTAPEVTLNVVPFPTVTVPRVSVEVVPVRPPVPTSNTAAPPVMLLPEVVRVPKPLVASVLLTSMGEDCVTVPLSVRL